MRDFDPDLVFEQVRALAADPAPFWARIRAAADRLTGQYDEMVTDLRARLGPVR